MTTRVQSRKKPLTARQKSELSFAVKKTVEKYGKTLKMLSKT